MNIAFLPDLSALAILIFILALVRRRHPEARADAWLLGLFFTLVEAAAHTLYAPQGMPDRVLHLTVLDCYLLAGLVFNWAAGDQNVPRGTRLVYLSANGATLLALTSIYGWNVRVPEAYLATILVGMVVGVASSLFLRNNVRYALMYLFGWSALGLLISQGRFRPAVYWSLAVVYAIAAFNFQRRLARRSTGKLAIVTGFAIWAFCFLLHPWVVSSTVPGLPDIASHVWNMQKSLISIGMILVMLEEQVSNNEWLALHDELTGLPNRRLFAARLTTAIEHTDRRNTSLALVVLDLNDFKKINDTMGHVAGDQVLREVSAMLRKSIRASDTVARLGGDEFIIVATDMSESAVERFTEALRAAIERPIMVNEQAMVVGASFGFALYPRDAKDATKLLRLADQRMYGLKRRPVNPAAIPAAAAIQSSVQQA